MSKASDFGVLFIERKIRPVLEPEGEVPLTCLVDCGTGDLIAYLLHWYEAMLTDAGESEEDIQDAVNRQVASALYHWEAERGEGDDISNDPSYDDMTKRWT